MRTIYIMYCSCGKKFNEHSVEVNEFRYHQHIEKDHGFKVETIILTVDGTKVVVPILGTVN